ncbi:MAG TPA: hypothetical protein VKQ72_01000 [Aggregatilineales bacterium]|nr:hypothetical protein [Aggregatilineales bacterium]
MRLKMVLFVTLFTGILLSCQGEGANAATAPSPTPITVANVVRLKTLQSITLENFPDETSGNLPIAIAFDPRLKRAAGVIDAQTVRIWDLATGKAIIDLKNPPADKPAPDSVEGDLSGALAFSPDGTRLATGLLSYKGYKTILWDVATGHLLTVLNDSAVVQQDPGIPYSVSSVLFTPDSSSVVICERLHDNVTTWLWTIQTRQIVSIGGETDELMSMNQKMLALPTYHLYNAEGTPSDQNTSVQVFDLQPQTMVHEITLETDKQVFALAISPDGSWLAEEDIAGVLVWSVITGQRLASLSDVPDLTNAQNQLVDMTFGPDNRLLFANDNGKLHFWDANSGKTLMVSNSASIDDAALNQDGTQLASLRQKDRTVDLWGIP